MIDIDRTLRLLDVEAESNFVMSEAIDAINYLREENARLREALKLMIDTQDEWEKSVAKVIGKQPNVFNRTIDTARSAMGESDE